MLAPSASAGPLERTVARADAPPSQLTQTRTMAGPEGGLVQRYEQEVGGLPVFGAELVAVDGPETAPILVSDSTVAGLDPADASSAISRSAAIAAARDAVGVHRLRAPAVAELGIDPGSGGLAWEVTLPADDPLADWLVAVDARSGEKLRARDLLRHATGSASIFDPNPVVEQGSYRRPQGQEGQGLHAAHPAAPAGDARAAHETARAASRGTYVDVRVDRAGEEGLQARRRLHRR